MEVGFCIEALKEALAKYGAPKIFNTDQGSQFTSSEFTQVLKDADVKISMDGRGRALSDQGRSSFQGKRGAMIAQWASFKTRRVKAALLMFATLNHKLARL